MTDVQVIEADINYQKQQERERDPNDTTPVVPKDYLKMSRFYYDGIIIGGFAIMARAIVSNCFSPAEILSESSEIIE